MFAMLAPYPGIIIMMIIMVVIITTTIIMMIMIISIIINNVCSAGTPSRKNGPTSQLY